MADIVEVVFPFASGDADQISLTVGERIKVMKKGASGWWIGQDSRGMVGAFPASYTKEVKEKPKFNVPKELKTAMLATSAVAGSAGPSPIFSNTSSTSAESGLSLSQRRGSWQPAAMTNPNIHQSMSAGDKKQMKELLGLDDDEDEYSPEKLLNGGKGGDALSPDTTRRMAFESLLNGDKNNYAGNHRSLFDANANRRRSTLSAPDSFGGSRETALVEQVISLRKEVKHEQVNIEKIRQQEVNRRKENAEGNEEVLALKQQVDQVKTSIQLRQFAVADLEKRIEVARACAEGEPLPEYDPSELAQKISALKSGADKKSAASQSQTPSATTPSVTPRAETVPSTPAEKPRNEQPAPVEDPSAEEIEKDPVAKKLIRKLLKRIAEAEDTKDSYDKQQQKILKRIAKYEGSLAQLDGEIKLLQGTLDSVNNTGSSPQQQEARKKRSFSPAAAADDEGSTQGSEAEETEAVRQRKIQERRFRKLAKSLPQEEQDDVEKYQLAEIRLAEKIAKLKEQFEGDTAEITALKQQVEKNKKRLNKGDDALQLLLREKEELSTFVKSNEGSAVKAQQSFKEAEALLVEKTEAVRLAQAHRDAAALKVETERAQLLARIDKERERLTAFEAELKRLIEKSA